MELARRTHFVETVARRATPTAERHAHCVFSAAQVGGGGWLVRARITTHCFLLSVRRKGSALLVTLGPEE